MSRARACPFLFSAMFLATLFFWRIIVSETAEVKIVGQQKDDGYRGIWYYCNHQPEPYRYKYSGGLGTYCAKHIPLAYYSPKANKTFFCYGGTVKGKQQLLEMVSYYDHTTGMLPRPTILMNKGTEDAHDNPVLMLDDDGYVWVFASAHGTARQAYIFRSRKPFSVDAFDLVREFNFSYPQPWFIPGKGFLFLHTIYVKGRRFLHWRFSKNGKEWTEPQRLAAMEKGHYQISWRWHEKVGTAFNEHPAGPDSRTNLYYMETSDLGQTWTNAQGEKLNLPLTEVHNKALVHDYSAQKLLVYMKDLNFDADGRPVILFVTSPGYQPGPQNNPRTWTVAHWTGNAWDIRPVCTSDSNYDTGCLHVEDDGTWRIIGPTETGPQPYNPGGEMAMWISKDHGQTWTKVRQITKHSPYNHTYARRPVNAHPDFYAFWADGHGLRPSESHLYFCNKTGEKVFRLPYEMKGAFAKPERVTFDK